MKISNHPLDYLSLSTGLTLTLEEKDIEKIGRAVSDLEKEKDIVNDVVKTVETLYSQQTLFRGKEYLNDTRIKAVCEDISCLQAEHSSQLYAQTLSSAVQVDSKLTQCVDTASWMKDRVSTTIEEIYACYNTNEAGLLQLKALRYEQWLTQWKKKIINALMDRFSIPNQVVEVLSSRVAESESLDATILTSLEHVERVYCHAKEVHNFSKQLFSSVYNTIEDQKLSPTLPLAPRSTKTFTADVLKTAEELLKLGHEKLLVVTLKQLYSQDHLQCNPRVGKSGSITMSSTRQDHTYKAINLLKHHPSLFRVLVGELLKTRSDKLQRILSSELSFDLNIQRRTEVRDRGYFDWCNTCRSRPLLHRLQTFYNAVEDELSLALLIMCNTSDATKEEQEDCMTEKPYIHPGADKDIMVSLTALQSPDTLSRVTSIRTAVDFIEYALSDCQGLLQQNLCSAIQHVEDNPVAVCDIYCMVTCFVQSMIQLLEPSSTVDALNELVGTLDVSTPASSIPATTFVRECIEVNRVVFDALLNVWRKKILWIGDLFGNSPMDKNGAVSCFLDHYVTDLIESLALFKQLEQRCPHLFSTMIQENGVLEKMSQTAIGPLLNHIRRSSLNCDNKRIRAIYLVNCYTSIHEALSRHNIVKRYSSIYSTLVQEELDNFVQLESVHLLHDLGFQPRLEQLREWRRRMETLGTPENLSGSSLLSIACLHPVALATFLQSFYNTLFLTDAIPLKGVLELTSVELQDKARRSILQRVVDAYEELCSLVTFSGFVPQRTQKICQLLGI